MVWLEATNLKRSHGINKLLPKREGPFPITEVLGPLTYRLKLPAQWKIHPVFHASLLTPFRESDVHGPSFSTPPPELVDGEEEYVVEAITAHRKYRNRMQYRIKWKGYSSSEDTWEPESHLRNAAAMLQEYKLKHRID